MRLEIRQVKVLSVRLNFSLLIDLKNADAVNEKDISRLGLKTQSPFDGSFLTSDRNVKRLDSDFFSFVFLRWSEANLALPSGATTAMTRL